MPRLAIFTDEPGWHGRQLKRAFQARGVGVSYVSLARCRIDLSQTRYGVFIPGFANTLPDAAFVRAIPAGSFEQITLRLDFLHALAELGVPVYNSARAIERSVDKAMTSFLLKRAGIPTLPTWVTENAADARKILMREFAAGHAVVVKPMFGSQGEGLHRLRAGDKLPATDRLNGVYYLQRFLDTGEGAWHDFRVFVIGATVAASMMRRGKIWISNIAQGARAEALDSPAVHDALASLAVAAVAAIGMDYAGVDLIRDANDTYYVVEVNGIPAWRGLQRVTPFSIADRLAQDLIARKLTHRLEASA